MIEARPWKFQDLLDDLKEMAQQYNPNMDERYTSLMMAHDFLKGYNDAYKVANNAIYFDDSSDYETALYEVCQCLRPDCEDEHGKEYIE